MTKSQIMEKIPFKLLAVFLLLAAGVSAGGFVFYKQQRARSVAHIQEDLNTIAQLKSDEITAWRRERYGDAYVITRSQQFAYAIRRWYQNPVDKKLKEYIYKRLDAFRIYETYKDVILVDPAGKTKMFIDQGGSENLSQVTLDIVRETGRQNRIIFSDFYYCGKCQEVHLDIITPLRVGAINVGSLILRINPDKYLYPLIQRWPSISRSGETVLVRKEGNEIVYLNELRHQKGTAMKLRLSLTDTLLPAAMAALGREGLVEGMDYRGVPVVAAVTHIDDSPWYMVAKMDKDEIYAPLKRQARSILIFIILIIILLAAVLSYIWQADRRGFYRKQYQLELDRLALIKHYDYLTKYANDIIILLNEDRRIVEINERGVQTYGYSREELLGKDADMLRAANQREKFKTQMKELIDKGSLFYETAHRRKDGSNFPVEISARTIEIEGKKYLQCIIRDISERKQAEAALRESEGRMRAKLDALLLPEGDIGALTLADIIDCRALQTMMEEFYRFTHIGIGILDNRGQVLVGVGWQDICTKFHRVHPDTLKNCLESDINIAKNIPNSAIKAYHCNNNMWDIMTPIVIGGRHFGNVCLGQFIYEDEVPDYELFKKQAQQYGFDQKEYLAALDRVPRWSHETVDAVVKFYARLAEMISSLSYSTLKLARTTESLRQKNEEIESANQILATAEEEIRHSHEQLETNYAELESTNEELKVAEEELKHQMEELQQSKDELLFSQTRFSQLFLGINSGVAVYRAVEDGADFVFEDFNPAGQKIEHTAKDRVIGKKVTEVFPGVKPMGLFEVFQRVWRTGNPEHHPVSIYKDDHLEGWRENYVYKLPSGEIVAVYDDLTEQKKAEIALKNSEAKLRRFYESEMLGVIYWNTEGVITDANDKFLEMTGYTRDDLTTGRVDWMNMTPPEFRYLDENSLAELKAFGYNKVPFEKEYIRKDGSRMPIILAGAMIDEARINGVAFVLDITERRQAEQAVQDSEEKYRLVFETANVGKSMTLPGGEVQANQAFCDMLGYTCEEMKHKTWQELTPLEDVAEVQRLIDPLIRGEKNAVRFNKRYRRKDGAIIWTDLSTVARRDHSGKLLNFITTVVDITERKLNEELLRINEQRYRTAQAIGHVGNWEYNIQKTTFWGSDEAKRIYGFNLANNDFTTDEIENCIPERKRVHQALVDLIEKGKEYNLEFEIHPINSSSPRIITSKAELRRDDQGKPLKVVGVIQDITERKQAEEQIQKQMAELKTMYEAMLGREDRVREVKEEVNNLLKEMGRPERYMT